MIVHQPRFAVATVISGTIKVMSSGDFCDFVDMIIVMDVIFR